MIQKSQTNFYNGNIVDQDYKICVTILVLKKWIKK